MMKKPSPLAGMMLLTISATLMGGHASASSLCSHGVVSVGDSYEAVEKKCGKPDHETILQVAQNAPSNSQYPHAAITLWFYGPKNGAVTQIRFSDNQVINTITYRPNREEEQDLYKIDP